MEEKIIEPGSQPEKLDRSYKKKRVEEIGSTLAQIRARHKANRSSCPKKEDDLQKMVYAVPQEKNEKTEIFMQIQEDLAKAVKLEKERPKMKEEMEKLKVDREQLKMVEKQIEETRAKQAAPLPEISPEVQKRIASMEMTIHSLREGLSIKDRVLSSKTESLKMLNQQLLQKGSEFTEKAESMRKEVASLKQEYMKQEENLRGEMAQYKARLEETEIRLSEKDAEFKTLEGAMNTLKESHSLCESNLQEAKHSLEAANKLALKMKAQIKALRTENANLKKENLNPQMLESLHNRIALLEEEKGNLQLQLVDFEESKEVAVSAQMKVQQLEDFLSDKNNLLDSLTEQKNSILRNFEDANQKILEQDEVITSLKASLKEMEQFKIAAELKSVELEEKLESEIREENKTIADKLEKEIQDLKNSLAEQEAHVECLNVRLKKKEQEMNNADQNTIISELDNWKTKCLESESQILAIQQQNENFSQTLKELKLANEELMRNRDKHFDELDDREKQISDYKVKVEELLAVVLQNKGTISSLESETKKLREEETKMRRHVQAEKSSQLDHQDQTQKVKLLTKNLKMRAKMCQDLENKLEDSKRKVADLESANSLLKGEKEALELRLTEFERKSDSIVDSAHDASAMDAKIQLLKTELEQAEAKYSESLEEIEKYKNNIEKLKLEMVRLEEETFKKQVDYSESYSLHIATLEEEHTKLQSLLTEKGALIEELLAEKKKLMEQMEQGDIELVRFQKLFDEESEKNIKALANFEHLESELAINREQVSGAVNQSEELSKIYEEAVNRLQERNSYIALLEEEIALMKSKVEILEMSIEEKNKFMENKVQNLGEKLKLVEVLKEDSVRCQKELITALSAFAEKEGALNHNIEDLKHTVANLEERNKELTENNSLLEQSKETSIARIIELETELETLKDIRSAYNNTLDQIEVLNEDLKQVMAEIESRNQELVSITEERRILAEKVSELEDTCTDLQTQHRDMESHMENLKAEVELRQQNLEQANQETLSLQAHLSTADDTESHGNASEIKCYYEGQINALRQEKEELMKLLKREVTEEVNKVMNAAEEKVSEMSGSREEVPSQMGVFQWQDSARDSLVDEAKDEDDGWGWIAPDQSSSRDDDLRSADRIQELLFRIQELEEEKNRLLAELKLSQKKCGALVKKAKEMKSRNEILEKSKSEKTTVGFEDLEFALQEEMRSEIDKSQQKNKELSAELKSLKAEKERLLKRIDTLVSANDELIQMKERQDIEVQIWQKKSNELKNQVQGLEWNLEELRVVEGGTTSNDGELEEKLTALVTENEELQNIICDLKDRLAAAESELNVLQEDLKIKENEDDMTKLEQNLDSLREEVEHVRQENELLSKKNNELNATFFNMTAEKDSLQTSLQAVLDECEYHKSRIVALDENISHMDSRIAESSRDKAQIGEMYNSAITENDRLCADLMMHRSENESLKHIIDGFSKDNNELKILLSSSHDEMDASARRIIELEGCVDQLTRKVMELEEEATKGNQPETKVKIVPQESSPPVFRGFSFVDEIEPSSESLKLTLKETEDELASSRGEVERLTLEKSRLMDEFTLNLEAQTNAHAVKTNEFLSHFETKEQEVAELRGRLDIAGRELMDLRQIVSELTVEREARKEGIVSRLSEIETECQHWKQEACNLSAQLDAAGKSFESKLTETRLNFEAVLKEREENFRNELLNREEENAHLTCEVTSRDLQRHAEVTELKDELNTLTENVEKLSEENRHLSSSVSSLKQENISLRQSQESSVEQMNQVLAEKCAANEYLTQKSEQQEAVIVKLKHELDDLRQQCDSFEEECSRLNSSLMKKSEEVNRLGGDLKVYIDDRSRLELLLGEYEQRVKLFEGELVDVSKLKDELTQRASHLEETIADKDQSIERLQTILSDTQEHLIKSQEGNMTDEALGLQRSLDRALYTLHQTDVKCEELSLEIMRLLEERDTLQLKLSNTLRENEILKQYETRIMELSSPEQPPLLNDETSSQSSLTIAYSIDEKINELHSTYGKDPNVQNDREMRHSQQMNLYAQMKSAKDEELNTSADYGILNWFFGSSSNQPPTPKPETTTT